MNNRRLEPELNEIFTYEGERLQCLKHEIHEDLCSTDCAVATMKYANCFDFNCGARERKDKLNVYFKKIEHGTTKTTRTYTTQETV